MNPLRLLFWPVALLYSFGVWFRNKLFDLGVFHEHSFDVFTVNIGNLSTGGTGKTPHVIYFLEHFKKEFDVACLSRGYGRKTNGYLVADESSKFEDIGDEPVLIKSRFHDVPMVVCESRVNGIRQMQNDISALDMIVLDDAYQHRSVKPEVNILLTEYSRPYVEDYILPVGNLREPAKNSIRADIIVVTKCPAILSPLDRRALIDKLNPGPHQTIYFSYMEYDALAPVDELTGSCPARIDRAVLFTGIANSDPLYYYLQARRIELTHLKFPDHHTFSKNDVDRLINAYESLPKTGNNIIITTEKDFMRMKNNPLFESAMKLPMYIQPIEVKFHGDDGDSLKKQITEYVRRNQVHTNLSKKEGKKNT